MKRGFADLIMWAVVGLVTVFIALAFAPVIWTISSQMGATNDPIASNVQNLGVVVFIAVAIYGAWVVLFPR